MEAYLEADVGTGPPGVGKLGIPGIPRSRFPHRPTSLQTRKLSNKKHPPTTPSATSRHQAVQYRSQNRECSLSLGHSS